MSMKKQFLCALLALSCSTATQAMMLSQVNAALGICTSITKMALATTRMVLPLVAAGGYTVAGLAGTTAVVSRLQLWKAQRDYNYYKSNGITYNPNHDAKRASNAFRKISPSYTWFTISSLVAVAAGVIGATAHVGKKIIG